MTEGVWEKGPEPVFLHLDYKTRSQRISLFELKTCFNYFSSYDYMGVNSRGSSVYLRKDLTAHIPNSPRLLSGNEKE